MGLRQPRRQDPHELRRRRRAHLGPGKLARWCFTVHWPRSPIDRGFRRSGRGRPALGGCPSTPRTRGSAGYRRPEPSRPDQSYALSTRSPPAVVIARLTIAGESVEGAASRKDPLIGLASGWTARAYPGSQQAWGPGSRCGSDQRAVMPSRVGQRRADSYSADWAMRTGFRMRGSRERKTAAANALWLYGRRPTV